MSPLNKDEQQWLLAMARRAIAAALSSGTADSASPESEAPSDPLRRPSGAFVTLHSRGTLRGCIGYIEPRMSLCQTVHDAALAAAFRDPRFPPVTLDEEKELEVEISVLSPLFPIRPEEITVGRHGLVVVQGSQRGLLLPQVPVEQGWSSDRFLEETCRKAGLPGDAWAQQGTSVYAFTAFVFSDGSIAAGGPKNGTA